VRFAWSGEGRALRILAISIHNTILEQFRFEMLHISKFSFSKKKRFPAESTPRCGALHFCAASEHLHFFKGKMP